MSKLKDLTGQRFGRLVVKERVTDKKYKRVHWICQCTCGNPEQIIVASNNLLSGHTQSCGCLHKETVNTMFNKCNKYDLSGEYGIGWTSNANEEFYFDLEDYDKIKDYCWMLVVNNNGRYKVIQANKHQNNQIIKLYKLITNYDVVDHINRNTLDNRKCNLRNATLSQNSINKTISVNNTSGVIGVAYDKFRNVWIGYVTVDKKRKIVYRGTSFEDAVKARLEAEKKYYGEFAPQKHLYEQYNII